MVNIFSMCSRWKSPPTQLHLSTLQCKTPLPLCSTFWISHDWGLHRSCGMLREKFEGWRNFSQSSKLIVNKALCTSFFISSAVSGIASFYLTLSVAAHERFSIWNRRGVKYQLGFSLIILSLKHAPSYCGVFSKGRNAPACIGPPIVTRLSLRSSKNKLEKKPRLCWAFYP